MILLVIGFIMIALGLMILLWPERKEHATQDHAGKAGLKETAEEKKAERAEIKGGAVIMIGPIPIIVGSDSKTALLMILLALAIMLIWMLAIRGG